MKTNNPKADETIVDEILQGDRDSFAVLIRRYQQHIFSIGMRFLKNHEDASDFVQEVFIKVYNKLTSYKKIAPFRYWLTKIAYNHGINTKQKKNLLKPGEIEAVSPQENPEDIEVRNEAKEALLLAIKKLPEEYQICLDFYFFLGLTHKEISEITSFPVNTIKSHVFRAKQTLRTTLQGTAAEDYYYGM